jgi:hypothetical protein
MFPLNSSRRKGSCAVVVFLISLGLLSSGCASRTEAGGVLTEQKIQAALAEIDSAALRRDADAIAGYFSEHAQIKINLSGFGVGKQSMTFGRDQYRDYARQSYAAIEAYDYQRRDTVIKIAPDGQTAYVSDQVFESATMMGRTVRSVTAEAATVKLEGGKVVISYLEGDVREN